MISNIPYSKLVHQARASLRRRVGGGANIGLHPSLLKTAGKPPVNDLFQGFLFRGFGLRVLRV